MRAHFSWLSRFCLELRSRANKYDRGSKQSLTSFLGTENRVFPRTERVSEAGYDLRQPHSLPMWRKHSLMGPYDAGLLEALEHRYIFSSSSVPVYV